MRMSCNGCRVLRKGCCENCSIRPCLQWIKNPESQANATVFLAKFYGRAGLMNLINAGPDHLRPAIFRSLLFEACGRIINPIYGAVGLLCSGNWHLCQAAVDAVLKGAPILQISPQVAADATAPLLHNAVVSPYDIRHLSKDQASIPLLLGADAAAEPPAALGLHKVNKASRNSFKRSADPVKGGDGELSALERRPLSPETERAGGRPSRRHGSYGFHAHRTPSHGLSLETPARGTVNAAGGESAAARASENDSEGSIVCHAAEMEKGSSHPAAEDGGMELDLTLGPKPAHHSRPGPYTAASAGTSRHTGPTRGTSALPAAWSCPTDATG